VGASSSEGTAREPAYVLRPSAKLTQCSLCWVESSASLASVKLFSFTGDFYDSTSLGPVKVYESLVCSQGIFAFLLIAVAVMAFTVTSVIEETRESGQCSVTRVQTLEAYRRRCRCDCPRGILLLLPDRRTRLIEKVSSPEYQSALNASSMDADELAGRISSRPPPPGERDMRCGAAASREESGS